MMEVRLWRRWLLAVSTTTMDFGKTILTETKALEKWTGACCRASRSRPANQQILFQQLLQKNATRPFQNSEARGP